jgi:hypothetical protein
LKRLDIKDYIFIGRINRAAHVVGHVCLKKGYCMARIDLEQEIFEFLDYEIRHGMHKDAAEAIRARLAEAQPQADNSPMLKLPPVEDCMQAIGYWKNLSVDSTASLAAQEMYAYIKRQLQQ